MLEGSDSASEQKAVIHVWITSIRWLVSALEHCKYLKIYFYIKWILLGNYFVILQVFYL